MMENESHGVLTFPARFTQPGPEEPCLFLFSISQVADVLETMTVCPVPFSPFFIQGVAKWRHKAVPVFSPEGCLMGEREYGKTDKGKGKRQSDGERFVVTLGAVGDGRAEPVIFRAPGPVKKGPVPYPAKPVHKPDWISRPDLVRGIFQWDGQIVIVLDVGKLLDRRCF